MGLGGSFTTTVPEMAYRVSENLTVRYTRTVRDPRGHAPIGICAGSARENSSAGTVTGLTLKSG